MFSQSCPSQDDCRKGGQGPKELITDEARERSRQLARCPTGRHLGRKDATHAHERANLTGTRSTFPPLPESLEIQFEELYEILYEAGVNVLSRVLEQLQHDLARALAQRRSQGVEDLQTVCAVPSSAEPDGPKTR